MTYEDALYIAMEELYDAVENLRYNNKGYQKHVEDQCNRLLTARNVLCKAFEDAETYKTPDDGRAEIEVDFTDEELLAYMKMAHELDITFNQLMERALRQFLEENEE